MSLDTSGTLLLLHGLRVWSLDAHGAALGGPDSASALLSELFSHDAEWLALPVARLEAPFWELRTRLLGEFVQMFVKYSRGLAFLGDVTPQTRASESLRAFVLEANRGGYCWFVDDLDALGRRLAHASSAGRT